MVTETSDILRRFKRTASRQTCPECGAMMTLIDQRNEGGTVFVWYSCSRNGCDGQWLEAMSSNDPNCIKKAV